jgi:hypothetical protein
MTEKSGKSFNPENHGSDFFSVKTAHFRSFPLISVQNRSSGFFLSVIFAF